MRFGLGGPFGRERSPHTSLSGSGGCVFAGGDSAGVAAATVAGVQFSTITVAPIAVQS